MGPSTYLLLFARGSPGCAMCSLTAAMQATNCDLRSSAWASGQSTFIKRSDKAKSFEVLPRRWVVERTFAWLGRCRRLVKDWEKSIASSTAWALIASIRMLTRRTARYCWN